MDNSMSNYPPIPNPEQSHYNPVYSSSSNNAHQLLDPVQQDDGNNPNHIISPYAYPKVEHETLDPNTSSQIEQRIEQLQQQHQLQSQPPPQQQQQPLQPHQSPLAPQDPQGQGQDQTPNSKVNRLRKACDSCSIRKVKCDESGPPCRACSALDIPCTFERPSRRRGPPNRHAEAIKRRRLESPHGSGQSAPSSPTHAAQALAALSSHPAAASSSSLSSLSAESILPVETIDLLINDYFTYIHPICPFPHEPSFREAWRRREDYNNRPFLALLASMISALVASFPRRPKAHLKAQGRENLFPNHMALVDRCTKLCAAARGPGYLDSENLSVHDAATSYLIGLTHLYTLRVRQGRVYLGECMNILRALGLHKAKDNSFQHLDSSLSSEFGNGGPEEMMDNITLQIGRRVFWTIFVSAQSMASLGATFGELYIAPETPSDPYPSLPAEVDDFCIFPTHIDPQPPGLLPVITGFNANVRLYLADQPLTVMELAWGRRVDRPADWDRIKRVLRATLQRTKSAIEDLPPQLNIWSPHNVFNSNDNSNGVDLLAALQPSLGGRDPHMINFHDTESSPEDRRNMQYEIQKANVYASYLCLRSLVVEKYFHALEQHKQRHADLNAEAAAQAVSPDVMGSRLEGMLPSPPGPDTNSEQEMEAERENVIKDLLVVLSNIDRVNMEPNSDSFIHKIRFVASTVLDVPKTRRGSFAQQSESYLKTFIDILSKLEGTGPANSHPEQHTDEEAELRHWADLRENQLKFAQSGGLLGLGV